MAVTGDGRFYRFVGAGETVTGILHIRTILISHDAAATGVDPVVIKNGAGTVMFEVYGAAETVTVIPLGDGWRCNGIELDEINTGDEMTIFLN